MRVILADVLSLFPFPRIGLESGLVAVQNSVDEMGFDGNWDAECKRQGEVLANISE